MSSPCKGLTVAAAAPAVAAPAAVVDYPNLLVGADTSDDAAVYKINENQAVVVTTDFFMPIGALS